MFELMSAAELQLSARYAAERERRLEIARQIRQGRPSREGISRRLLRRAGDVLIAVGQELLRRYAWERPATGEARRA
jgi:hypothetical protein